VAPRRGEADLTLPASVRTVLTDYRPEVVFNCAADNFVDRAEREPEIALASGGAGGHHSGPEPSGGLLPGSGPLPGAPGGNIFFDPPGDLLADAEARPDHAWVTLKRVRDPQRYGVAMLEGGRVIAIEEKPNEPRGEHAVAGIYLYPPDVFAVIRDTRPGPRGEWEITPARLLLEVRTPGNFHPDCWNGLQVLTWKRGTDNGYLPEKLAARCEAAFLRTLTPC
jgi:hypothetical protein